MIEAVGRLLPGDSPHRTYPTARHFAQRSEVGRQIIQDVVLKLSTCHPRTVFQYTRRRLLRALAKRHPKHAARSTPPSYCTRH